MSISDQLMLRYYEVLTECDLVAIKQLHPKEAKMQLGEKIVEQFYSQEKAQAARQEFEKVFSRGDVPLDIVEYRITKKNEKIIDVLLHSQLVASKS